MNRHLVLATALGSTFASLALVLLVAAALVRPERPWA